MEPARIAILEDDDHTREMYVLMLKNAGYETVALRTGAELLAALRTGMAPHAIVMDLGLPDTQGVPLCRIIRSHQRFRSTPIIAVSGWSSGPYVQGLSEAPFNEVFLKPVEADLLLESLRRWVRLPAVPE